MEKGEQNKDFLSQWGEFQRNFFTQWADSYRKMYQPWMDAMKLWTNVKPPAGGFDLFSKWNEMIQETLGKAGGEAEAGLGQDVLFRMMRASKVFVIFNEFWMEILKDLPELFKARKDNVKSRKIFEDWADRYKKVFEQLMGSPVSESAEEMMTSWLNSMQMHQSAFGLMWNPWSQAMPQWQEQIERFMKGDWGAIYEARSLWREVYDETLGQVFRMPAFGLTKEQTERIRRTYDAFLKFWYSLPNFYQFFYKTGQDALKDVFDKIRGMKSEDVTPETMRDIYKLWWTTNEDVFFELFKRPDFSNAMAEVLHYGLRLKQRIDELTAEWCRSLSIPSNKEFDELAMVVHDLRRRLRQQQKTIEALQQKVEKAT